MPTASASRATTRSICSTSTIPGPRRAVPRIDACDAGRARWSSRIRRSEGSDCRCAMTCAFPSCTGSWSRGARSGWRCRRRSRCPPAARTGRRCCARAPSRICATWSRRRSAGTHTSGRETYGDTLDRRLLGPGAVAPAKGYRSDHGGIRSCETGGDARALPGARQSPAGRARRRGGAGMSAAPMFDVARENDPGALGLGRGPARHACSAR